MEIKREEVFHIASLAKLGLTENEVKMLSEQLSDIIDNFKILKQVDTENIPPTTQSIALQNVVKDDTVAASCPPRKILTNAPHQDGDFFRVHSVLGH
jgi:aspartyl-tRNA(Asn)/glutamyl-tRNA(Gln) amidotransferase subunit C